MLNLRQMDSIVHNNLLIFKGFKIKRREEGTNIFYDVHDRLESNERFLGTYRVWEWHDGSGRSGWVPFDNKDPEIERLRQMVWEAIMAIAVPANQLPPQEAAQVGAGKPEIDEYARLRSEIQEQHSKGCLTLGAE